MPGRPQVLLRGDDGVRAQLPPPGRDAARLEDHDRVPRVLTRVVASVPHTRRLFVAASHCSPRTPPARRPLLPPVRLPAPKGHPTVSIQLGVSARARPNTPPNHVCTRKKPRVFGPHGDAPSVSLLPVPSNRRVLPLFPCSLCPGLLLAPGGTTGFPAKSVYPRFSAFASPPGIFPPKLSNTANLRWSSAFPRDDVKRR